MWIHVDIPAHDVSLSENSAKLNGLKGFTFPPKKMKHYAMSIAMFV
jgi:hypothetical protein